MNENYEEGAIAKNDIELRKRKPIESPNIYFNVLRNGAAMKINLTSANKTKPAKENNRINDFQQKKITSFFRDKASTEDRDLRPLDQPEVGR